MPSTPPGPRRSWPAWAPVAAVLLGGIAAVALGVVIGTTVSERDGSTVSSSSPGAVDVGFTRDMRDHHAQAVEMSVSIREATTDPEVRNLALDILLTQQQQLGQMSGWLSSWGVTQTSSEAPMAWVNDAEAAAATDGHGEMDHDGAASGSRAAMPGMATDVQLRALGKATNRRAERLFLQLMIPHHRAGVSMARVAVEGASQSYVRRLAQTIVNSQSAELNVLQSMLAARGGPLPPR